MLSESNLIRQPLALLRGPALDPTRGINFMAPSIDRSLPKYTTATVARQIVEMHQTYFDANIVAFRRLSIRDLIQKLPNDLATSLKPIDAVIRNHQAFGEWVEKADDGMYGCMLFIMASWVTDAQGPIADRLNQLGRQIVVQIQTIFADESEIIRRAKHRAARRFQAVVAFFLRAHRALQPVRELLANPTSCRRMLAEWNHYVFTPRLVVEDMNLNGSLCVGLGLFNKFRYLFGIEEEHGQPSVQVPTADDLLKRWMSFLRRLPTYCPATSVRYISMVIKVIGLGAINQMKEKGMPSTDHWMALKSAIDHLMMFLIHADGLIKPIADCQFNARVLSSELTSLVGDDGPDSGLQNEIPTNTSTTVPM